MAAMALEGIAQLVTLSHLGSNVTLHSMKFYHCLTNKGNQNVGTVPPE